MDETNPGIFPTNWNAYPPTRGPRSTSSTCTPTAPASAPPCATSPRAADKPLWMSEVEGTWGDGTDFTAMGPGLGIASRIVDDLRELEPSAWVFWQPVEDYDNMKPAASRQGRQLGQHPPPVQLHADGHAEDLPDPHQHEVRHDPQLHPLHPPG